MRNITASELKAYLERTDQAPPVLVDVREPWEFQICHIENSKHIPMSDLQRVVNEFDPAQELVLICHHGVRSQRAGMMLAQVGFGNLVNLVGGINAWAREVDPNMPTY